MSNVCEIVLKNNDLFLQKNKIVVNAKLSLLLFGTCFLCSCFALESHSNHSQTTLHSEAQIHTHILRQSKKRFFINFFFIF